MHRSIFTKSARGAMAIVVRRPRGGKGLGGKPPDGGPMGGGMRGGNRMELPDKHEFWTKFQPAGQTTE